MNRRLFALSALAAVALASLVLPLAAVAAEKTPFEKSDFEAAQKAGSPILIDIAADWCPTCKAQAPIIQSLATKPEYKDLKIFHVNFDTQKDVVRQFKANQQSTLIAFKGTKEISRSVGDTRAQSIEALVKSAVGTK